MHYPLVMFAGILLSGTVYCATVCYHPGITNRVWLRRMLCAFFRGAAGFLASFTSRRACAVSCDTLVLALSGTTLSLLLWVYSDNWLDFFLLIVLAGLLSSLAVIDWRYYLLPDFLVFLVLWSGLLLSPALRRHDVSDLILGACTGYTFLWVLNGGYEIITLKQGIGHGDMKLLSALGAWNGWQQLPSVTLIASGIALVYLLAWYQHPQKPIKKCLDPLWNIFVSFRLDGYFISATLMAALSTFCINLIK